MFSAAPFRACSRRTVGLCCQNFVRIRTSRLVISMLSRSLLGEDRSWMYSGWNKVGNYTDEWMDKTTAFLDHVFSLSKIVRCPCSICQNTRCLEDKTTIAIHLCKNGFVPGYEVWKFHGESGTRVIAEDEHDYDAGVDRMDEMLEAIQAEVTEDPPTALVD
jgi:hypothetical protein